MSYKGNESDWSEEAFAEQVPLTPDAYRERYEGDLNEMRMAAGLPTKAVYELKDDVRSLQSMAGLR